MQYRIEYSPDAEQHLYQLPARQRRIVLDGVDRQLLYEPTAETRNRKRMRPNPIAPWELVGLSAMDLESFSLSMNEEFLAIIQKSRARYQKEGGVSSDELRRRLKNKLTQNKPEKNASSRGGRSKRKVARKRR